MARSSARRLREISGVGEAIANIVTRLHETGTHPGLAAMRKEVPAGVLEMLTVPGLRPEKVMKLYKELGITSLAALEAAAKADRLKGVKGLGPALQAKILQGIAIGREAEGRRHIHRAAALLRNAEQRLRQANPNLKRITPAGEFRRGCELVSDLSLVVELQGAEVGTMRSGSQLQQGGEDRLDVYLIARPAQQLPSGHVAEDCGKRICTARMIRCVWVGRSSLKRLWTLATTKSKRARTHQDNRANRRPGCQIQCL